MFIVTVIIVTSVFLLLSSLCFVVVSAVCVIDTVGGVAIVFYLITIVQVNVVSSMPEV